MVHCHRRGAEQVVRLHEGHQLVGRRPVGSCQGDMGGEAPPFRLQPDALVDQLAALYPDEPVSTYTSWSVQEISEMASSGRLDFALIGVCGESPPPRRARTAARCGPVPAPRPSPRWRR